MNDYLSPHPPPPPPRPYLQWRSAVLTLAVAALLLPLITMAQLHPHQRAYFNLLVDRATPERLRTQYDLYLGGPLYYDALRFLLARYPEAPIYLRLRPGEVNNVALSRRQLPPEDRPRVLTGETGDFAIINYRQPAPAPEPPGAANPAGPTGTPIYNHRVFNNTVATILALDPALAAAGAAPANRPWRQVWQSLAPLEPAARAGGFAIYRTGRRLVYVKENCAAADAETRFFLHLYPAPDARHHLPESRQPYGYANLDFSYYQHGGWHQGTCLAAANLPNYPIAHIHTGQYNGRHRIWEIEIRN